jgi:uncharacterized membrane protein
MKAFFWDMRTFWFVVVSLLAFTGWCVWYTLTGRSEPNNSFWWCGLGLNAFTLTLVLLGSWASWNAPSEVQP